MRCTNMSNSRFLAHHGSSTIINEGGICKRAIIIILRHAHLRIGNITHFFNMSQKGIFRVFAFFLISFSSYAQQMKEGSIWYFTHEAGINFKIDPPEFLGLESGIPGFTHSSAISDSLGNLLFYSDGRTVWTRDHEIMENGDSLISKKITREQSAIIIPHPGDGQLYYIFMTNPFYALNEGFHYAIVDLSLNGGKGAVIQKRVNLKNPVSKVMSAVSHATESSIWIVCHSWENDEFHVFNISEAGISPPVTYKFGEKHIYNANFMNFSPDGTKLALAMDNALELYDFNAKTGVISNYRSLRMGAGGVEFSPNSELLYATNNYKIFQFDLRFDTEEEIFNSRLEVGKYNAFLEDLSLAYNGKIYCTRGGGHGSLFIKVINNPNVRGIGCDFMDDALLVPGWILNLPMGVQSFYRESPQLIVEDGCVGDTLLFTISSLGYADSLTWEYGDQTKETFPGQVGKTTYHVYNKEGAYPLILTKYIDGVKRKIEAKVRIFAPPSLGLGEDTTLCEGQKIRLQIEEDPKLSYKWSTGDTISSILIGEGGTFSIEINDEYCTNADSIQVSYLPYPDLSDLTDTLVCVHDEILLSTVHSPAYKYIWSTGEDASAIRVGESGVYEVEVSNNHCITKGGIKVSFEGINKLALDQYKYQLVEDEPLNLSATGSNIDQWTWDFGDGYVLKTDEPNSFHAYEAGKYKGSLLTTNKYGCFDSVNFEVDVPFYLFIPNVFTPNNDFCNDVFDIKYNGPLENYKLEVLNRYGKQVFSSHEFENKWTGQNVPSAVYFYIIYFNTEETRKGWVQVMK